MVQLVLTSSKGNAVRYWPHTGYLGLTPVVIDGLIATKLDPDLKLLPARSISVSVKCYEYRIGKTGILQSNVLVDYSQMLWSKPDDQEYDSIGDAEYPFRISIPPHAGGFSTSTFVEYKCVWRVEAVLTHIHITGIGSRQIKQCEIALTRYDVPPPLPSLSSSRHSSPPLLNLQTNKPRAPRINYSMSCPTTPIGPMDIIPVSITLQPLDPNVVFRTASLSVERRIQLHQVPALYRDPVISAPGPLSPSGAVVGLSTRASDPALASTSSLSSDSTITPHTFSASTTDVSTELQPLINRTTRSPSIFQVVPKKTISHSITEVESSGSFTSDSGTWSRTFNLQWPMPKSNSRWGIGETIRSQLVAVRFFLRVKILLTTPLGSDTVELQERELLIVSTNESERRLAWSKYSESTKPSSRRNSRTKVKSRRRSRQMEESSSQISSTPASASRIEHSHKVSSCSSQYPGGAKTKPMSRRPHTSAGPRDKILPRTNSDTFPGEDHDPFRWKSPHVDAPESSKNTLDFFPSRIATHPSASSTSSTSASASLSDSSQDSDDVKEWEAELAQIEFRSRRSSDMLAFINKQKKSCVETDLLLSGSL